jgi:hypothetical protein
MAGDDQRLRPHGRGRGAAGPHRFALAGALEQDLASAALLPPGTRARREPRQPA